MPRLFEAVPNFSEGRDEIKISRIVESVREIPGVRVLDLHSDPDHSRSVLTLVGEEEPLLEAARAGDPRWRPDYGPAELSQRLGAVAVGARPFLLAFNAYLDTEDVEVARVVAREIRERDSGLPGVKALGLSVGGKAQVSMNLTDLDATPLPVALEAVRAEAGKRGVSVEHTELVGLIPQEALLQTARHYLALQKLAPEHVLEHKTRDIR